MDPSPYLTQLSLSDHPPFITCRIALRFDIYAFLCFMRLVIFLHKSQIFGVISLIVQPPHITQLSLAEPTPPLSMSDIISERSLIA